MTDWASENNMSKASAVQPKHPICSEDFHKDFVILEILRESVEVGHYVVEDLQYGDVFYVKRISIIRSEEFNRQAKYYKVLEEFGANTFSPRDLLRYFMVNEWLSAENPSLGELLVFAEWGDFDCIDLARITLLQTVKFLKNVLEILQATYAGCKLTHGNIKLENVVLVRGQLKLAGWKPVPGQTLEEGTKVNWRRYVYRNYGKARLDLVLVGLLWLQLLTGSDQPPVMLDVLEQVLSDSSENTIQKLDRFVEEHLGKNSKLPQEHVIRSRV